MRSDIFIEWLKYLDNYFHIKNKKILLLIDNAGSHLNQKDLNKIMTMKQSLLTKIAKKNRLQNHLELRKIEKKINKKNLLIFLLLISNLCTFYQIRPPTYNQWMHA